MKASAIRAFVAVSFIASAADYTTYIGDESNYKVDAMTTDAAGNTYIVSTHNPPNEFTFGLVLTKLDPSGSLLLTSILSEGTGDQANGIAVDPSGDIYIVGAAGPGFPLLNPTQSSPASGGNPPGSLQTGFLMKLSPDGGAIYSTYFGGSQGASSVNGVAVDQKGAVYLVGTTSAVSQPPLGTNTSVFWVKITPDGSSSYQGNIAATMHACGGGSTCFLSGIATVGAAIAVDPAGNAYIAGNTYGDGLPTTPGALVSNGIGAFVVKVDPSGKTLYSTLLGSGDWVAYPEVIPSNLVTAIAADVAGNAYVVGRTSDPNFPATASAFQSHAPQCGVNPCDGFVAKLNPTGTAMVWATFLGGSSDAAQTIAVDPAGNVWTSGTTSSPDFPDSTGFPNGQEFLLELNSSGSALVSSALYPANTVASAISLDSAGILHMAGSTGLVSTLTPSGSQAPRVFGLANAAGGVLAGRIAPGEVISIYGLHFGDAATAASFDSSEALPTTVGGIQVTILGQPAPLLFVSDTQINAIVPIPANVPGGFSETSLILTTNGTSLTPVRLFVNPALPEIFQTLPGIAAAINQDGTVNSRANPAKPASYISIWASGAIGTGVGSPLGVGNESKSAGSYGSCDCAIQTFSGSLYMSYLGTAPGMPAAVTQVNFQLPPQASNAFSYFWLTVDGAESDRVLIFVAP